MNLKDSILHYTFCSAITCGDVNYDYMPEAFATWMNKWIILHLMKKKAEKLLGQTRSYFRILFEF